MSFEINNPNVKILEDEAVKISDKAAEEIRRIIRESEIPGNYVLRLGVRAGGCSGLSYVLAFDEIRDGDNVFISNGIKVTVDSKSLFYLSGTELDFVDSLMGRGFVFHNPNATRSCGCGQSFSV
jgi:iron-sulfur cluster assembly protein